LITPAGGGPGGRTAAAAVDIPTKLRISPAPASPVAISRRTFRNDAVGAHLHLSLNIFVSLVSALLRSGRATLLQDMVEADSMYD